MSFLFRQLQRKHKLFLPHMSVVEFGAPLPSPWTHSLSKVVSSAGGYLVGVDDPSPQGPALPSASLLLGSSSTLPPSGNKCDSNGTDAGKVEKEEEEMLPVAAVCRSRVAELKHNIQPLATVLFGKDHALAAVKGDPRVKDLCMDALVVSLHRPPLLPLSSAVLRPDHHEDSYNTSSSSSSPPPTFEDLFTQLSEAATQSASATEEEEDILSRSDEAALQLTLDALQCGAVFLKPGGTVLCSLPGTLATLPSGPAVEVRARRVLRTKRAIRDLGAMFPGIRVMFAHPQGIGLVIGRSLGHSLASSSFRGRREFASGQQQKPRTPKDDPLAELSSPLLRKKIVERSLERQADRKEKKGTAFYTRHQREELSAKSLEYESLSLVSGKGSIGNRVRYKISNRRLQRGVAIQPHVSLFVPPNEALRKARVQHQEAKERKFQTFERLRHAMAEKLSPEPNVWKKEKENLAAKLKPVPAAAAIPK